MNEYLIGIGLVCCGSWIIVCVIFFVHLMLYSKTVTDEERMRE